MKQNSISKVETCQFHLSDISVRGERFNILYSEQSPFQELRLHLDERDAWSRVVLRKFTFYIYIAKFQSGNALYDITWLNGTK